MASLVFGFIGAFLLAALPGKAAVGWLRNLGALQNISEDAPETHARSKKNTPTMGGLLILFSLTVTTLLYKFLGGAAVAQDVYLLPILVTTLAFGLIGFLDDYLSLRRGKNLGLRAREKFLAQCIIALGFAFWLSRMAQPGMTTLVTLTPNLGGELAQQARTIDFGLAYYFLVAVLMVGFSNATNFTDGLDGLSSGVTIVISLTLGALVSSSLFPTLAFFPIALAGGLAGFLWWNAHPAKMFMGDTGSLALGAGLTCVAVVAKQEIPLIIASLVCWAELFSVIIQVSVFKWRKRTKGIEYARANRVFRRTPLHHHFEKQKVTDTKADTWGWEETQIVQRFWLAGAICAALALLWGRG